MVEIRSIPEALATSKFLKIISTVVTSTLRKTKSSQSFWIWLPYSSVVLIPNLIFGRGDICSNKSIKIQKNQKKEFPSSFEVKETTPFYFNILGYLPPLEGTPKDFARVARDFSYFLQFFLQSKVFLLLNSFLSESFIYFKLPSSISLPDCLNFL